MAQHPPTEAAFLEAPSSATKTHVTVETRNGRRVTHRITVTLPVDGVAQPSVQTGDSVKAGSRSHRLIQSPLVRRMMPVLTLLLLFFYLILSVLQLSRTTLQGAVLMQLTIPSQSNAGVVFQAPVAGRYIFEYAAGGFLVYQPPSGANCDRSMFECYSTYLLAFRGDTVRWSGEDLNFPRTVLRLGEDKAAWTFEEAQAQAVGSRTSLWLNADEEITFVVGDLRSAYRDNTGEIILNVYFVPS